jgi:hypothetical protein
LRPGLAHGCEGIKHQPPDIARRGVQDRLRGNPKRAKGGDHEVERLPGLPGHGVSGRRMGKKCRRHRCQIAPRVAICCRQGRDQPGVGLVCHEVAGKLARDMRCCLGPARQIVQRGQDRIDTRATVSHARHRLGPGLAAAGIEQEPLRPDREPGQERGQLPDIRLSIARTDPKRVKLQKLARKVLVEPLLLPPPLAGSRPERGPPG